MQSFRGIEERPERNEKLYWVVPNIILLVMMGVLFYFTTRLLTLPMCIGCVIGACALLCYEGMFFILFAILVTDRRRITRIDTEALEEITLRV
jgi:RsiW-degrading membrane proteinase PrsW (M82 family)